MGRRQRISGDKSRGKLGITSVFYRQEDVCGYGWSRREIQEQVPEESIILLLFVEKSESPASSGAFLFEKHTHKLSCESFILINT
jgi:hypothetical protein